MSRPFTYLLDIYLHSCFHLIVQWDKSFHWKHFRHVQLDLLDNILNKYIPCKSRTNDTGVCATQIISYVKPIQPRMEPHFTSTKKNHEDGGRTMSFLKGKKVHLCCMIHCISSSDASDMREQGHLHINHIKVTYYHSWSWSTHSFLQRYDNWFAYGPLELGFDEN